MEKELIKTENSQEVSLKLKNFKDMIAFAEEMADYVTKSSFASNFVKNVPVLTENGEPIIDNLGNTKTEKKIDKNDIIACIMLGQELGIEPMKAIMLGNVLNKDAILKVEIGKTLGLSPIRSLDTVNVINTKTGTLTHLGVNVINKVLNETGVRVKILEDFKPVYEYVDVYENVNISEEEYEQLKNKHIVKKLDTEAEIKKLLGEGYSILVKKEITKRTKIEFKRKGQEPLIISYTLQEAVEAGLYKGVDSSKSKVEGKDNWNKHPATMLRNRVLTIGGRIIAGDKLNKIYSVDEAIEIIDDSEENIKIKRETIIEDAKIVEENNNKLAENE